MSIIAGRELKKAREAKGLSLNQVSEELYIRLTYLQAIENGLANILPSEVQGRGMVRLYSEYLGMDTNSILRVWDNPQLPYPPPPENDPNIPLVEHTRPQKVKKGKDTEKSHPQKNSEPPDQVAQKIFAQIGQELRQRRESLHLSLEDCASQTLVRESYLESIENGQFERLISFVQARGMLNNYAAFLDLDITKTMMSFAEALQLLNETKAEENGTNRTNPKKKKKATSRPGRLKRFLTPDLFIGLFVLLCMTALMIYSAIQISIFRKQQPQATVDMNASFQNQQESATPSALPLPSNTPGPNQLTLLQNQNSNQAPLEENDSAGNNVIQIYIASNQRSYLKVVADGKDVFIGRTLAGNTYPFDAQNMIEVTSGNAAAISITYNQEYLGTMGEFGQNAVFQFLPQMVVTPTLINSLTPTNTFEPTYTQVPETSTPTPTLTPYIP